jgi:NADH dehydrogenase [ubiquinone] 1 alpha subcomplex assembly factor 2
MDPLKGKYTPWQRLIHRWKARRDIPFRKQFFVGYDLHGNTYWEFTTDGNMQRLRRKLEPYRQELFEADYFSTIPPQWLQWLRRTRDDVPTLDELVLEEVRQKRIKLLAQQADAKWQQEKLRLEQEQQLKLQEELHKAEQDDAKYKAEHSKPSTGDGEEPTKPGELETPQDSYDPWKQADTTKDSNPIEESAIKPRR